MLVAAQFVVTELYVNLQSSLRSVTWACQMRSSRRTSMGATDTKTLKKNSILSRLRN